MSTVVLNVQLINEFGGYLRINEKSAYTIEKYLRDAEALRRFASGRPLTKELMVEYKCRLIESGKYADSSINSMIASLRAFFKYLGREDCIVAGIRTQETLYCPEHRSLTTEEFQRILSAAEGDRRLQMVLKVLAGTGIRISELRYFTVEALEKESRQGSIRVSCKKKSRDVILPDDLKQELLDYIKENGITEGAVFRTKGGKPLDRSNLWRQMKRLCREAGVDETKVFPHNVRKLFARMLYEKSHDIAQVACLLGHSSINTTTIYIRRTEREIRRRVNQIVKEILGQTDGHERSGRGSEAGQNPGGRGQMQPGGTGTRESGAPGAKGSGIRGKTKSGGSVPEESQ